MMGIIHSVFIDCRGSIANPLPAQTARYEVNFVEYIKILEVGISKRIKYFFEDEKGVHTNLVLRGGAVCARLTGM